MNRFPAGILVVVPLLAAGCTAPKPTDYSAYLDHMPRSILVLPPINHTESDRPPKLFVATISRPLAERGYYVFPVMVVDRLLREDGAESPAEMHSVPLKRLGELFGADAVLYAEIREWKTGYVVVATWTNVHISFRLVDTRSAVTLWQRQAGMHEDSLVDGSGGDPYAGALAVVVSFVAAQVQAVGALASDPGTRLVRKTIEDRRHGLLLGPRHPRFEEDQRRHRAEIEKRESRRAGW